MFFYSLQKTLFYIILIQKRFNIFGFGERIAFLHTAKHQIFRRMGKFHKFKYINGVPASFHELLPDAVGQKRTESVLYDAARPGKQIEISPFPMIEFISC